MQESVKRIWGSVWSDDKGKKYAVLVLPKVAVSHRESYRSFPTHVGRQSSDGPFC